MEVYFRKEGKHMCFILCASHNPATVCAVHINVMCVSLLFFLLGQPTPSPLIKNNKQLSKVHLSFQRCGNIESMSCFACAPPDLLVTVPLKTTTFIYAWNLKRMDKKELPKNGLHCHIIWNRMCLRLCLMLVRIIIKKIKEQKKNERSLN